LKIQPKKDFSSVDSRRSSASKRNMGIIRRLYYLFGLPVLRGLTWCLAKTYKIEKIIDNENIKEYLNSEKVCAPCYWHQHHVISTTIMHRWIKNGFKACFLISASVDGEVVSKIAKRWGAKVIRGSANQSGTLALRDMQDMMKKGYSIVTTADGPRGPQYEFKLGAILMARVSGVPIIAIGCAADRAWYLNRWDNFMIPKPFSRIVIAVGEPYLIPIDTPLNKLEFHRLKAQEKVISLISKCEETLKILKEAN